MDRPVKRARSYNSSRRQTQARETRAAVLAVAAVFPFLEGPLLGLRGVESATRLRSAVANQEAEMLARMTTEGYRQFVMDGEQFLGVATRLDLINYFRITP